MRVAVAGGTTIVAQEIITRLANNGHEVVAFDVTSPRDVVQWIKLDFRQPETVGAALEHVDGAFDAFVIAVDCAPREGHAREILIARFLSTRLMLEAMVARLSWGASILTIASSMGWRWRQNFFQVQELMKLSSADEVQGFLERYDMEEFRAYSIASEALIAMSTLKTEAFIAHGIRANTISPAAVNNEFFDVFTKRFGPKALANLARAGRVDCPNEIANVVEWMISEQSTWINGQDIIVDGGIEAMITSDHLRNARRSNQNQSVFEIATRRSVLKRSARVALVVGTVLAALNHGDRVMTGDADLKTLSKIFLTFCVPFCVSTYSSVIALRGNNKRNQPPI